MKYSIFADLYDKLGNTTKKLEKVKLISDFLPKLKDHEERIFLLRGRVFPEYDVREFGISGQLTVKAIAKATGISAEEVVEKFRKKGDYGDVAADLAEKKKQHALFSKELDVDHVLMSLRKISETEGHGSIERKMDIITELIGRASSHEARYLIRTLLSDLRVGVADALVLDAIVECFFKNDEAMKERVKHAYDLLTDFAVVLQMAFKGRKAFEHILISPGKPLNVMLPVKVTEIEEGFRICGIPAALEHKYDGFRMIITSDGKKIKLFTRRLEEVTLQFPDVVEYVKKYVKAKSFILDSEAVGYEPKKKKYLPFEAISQRIKRKYDIAKLIDELPVEVNVFDILYVNGKNTVELPFKERRDLLERFIQEERWKLRLSTQIVTGDLKEADAFYKEALKIGEEGIMIKNLNAAYMAGRYVGYMVKLKPLVADLDLVIVGAEYGTGKRAGGLTSFTVACRDNGNFLEVGNVSSGLKEKASEEGTTYTELNDILQKLITKEEGNYVHVRPKVVVSVTYQNIQGSPTYSSGFALRFPRITHHRPDRSTKDIATLDEIKRDVERSKRNMSHLG